jgi:hypothetical protein
MKKIQKSASPVELKQFITEALNEICDGVEDAKRAADKLSGSKINPVLTHYTNKRHPEYIGADQKLPPDVLLSRDGNVVVMVDFDLGITDSKGKGTKGGIGVLLGSVGLGTQGQSTQTNTSQSRVKFRVPIILPT